VLAPNGFSPGSDCATLTGKVREFPETPHHHEFLADEIWPEFAYDRNAVYNQQTMATL
jgi:hypothetical protein